MSRVVVGRVLKAHGVRGEVIVDPTGEDPARFARGTFLYLDPEGDEKLTVHVARSLDDQVLVTFEEVGDREEAEDLSGAVLHQEEEALPELPEGSYYHFQLVGLEVVRADGTPVGPIVRVHALPASDVFEVETEDHEWMIPRTDEFVASIDLAAGRVVLRAREDLLEAVGQARSQKPSPGTIRRRAREEARRKAWEKKKAEAEAKAAKEAAPRPRRAKT